MVWGGEERVETTNNDDGVDVKNKQQDITTRDGKILISIKDKELSKNPWKIVVQNMRGLITTNSKEKVGYLEDITIPDKILFMNITEM